MGKKKECDLCHKSFSRPSHLLRHMKNIHKIREVPVPDNTPKHLQCRVCDDRFSNHSSRRYHEKYHHKFIQGSKRDVRCSECLDVFKRRADIMQHFSIVHPNIPLETECKIFTSNEEFHQWKLQIENDTASSYVIRNSYRTKDSLIQQYMCHRSGLFESRGLGKRRVKISGSVKTGYFCPSIINFKKNLEGESNISASFILRHVGHNNDVGSLYSSIVENNDIPLSMQAEVSVPTILYNFSETASLSKELTATKTQKKDVFTNETCEFEKVAKSDKVKKQQFHQNLKENDVLSALCFRPYAESNTKDKQFKQIIQNMTDLKSNCRSSVAVEKQLLPIILKIAPSKEIQ